MALSKFRLQSVILCLMIQNLAAAALWPTAIVQTAVTVKMGLER